MEFETLFVKLQYPKLKKNYVSRKVEIDIFIPKYNNACVQNTFHVKLNKIKTAEYFSRFFIEKCRKQIAKDLKNRNLAEMCACENEPKFENTRLIHCFGFVLL